MSNMGSPTPHLHIFFLPFMAQGHMTPVVDMARIFASRGVKSTVVTTPINAGLYEKTIQRSKDMGMEIGLLLVNFPSAEVGLPEGCENLNQASSLEMQGKIFQAATLLEHPVDKLLHEHRPDCIMADMFFPWASDAGIRYGIPRLVFHGSGFFALCASLCLLRYQPHKKVLSDSEPFAIPNFPDEIKLTRNQLPDFIKQEVETDFIKLYRAVKESELRSYGTIVNSFYEIEPAYADHYRKVLGRRAWHIGPVSLFNRDDEDKAQRGNEISINEHECLTWLNSKRPNSVVYICFGSVANFSDTQLMEIATGLEASGQQFIWVVKKEKKNEGKEEWLPEGFEKRMEGKGLIVRGWAPQLLILDHKAIGGFVTHCGWNSVLEAVSAGVPMVTWPIAAEQFYNEKVVIQVAKIGVAVGVQQWARLEGDSIKSEAVHKAIRQIIEGEEAEEMRNRARELGKMARKAVEEGGSSYTDLTSLIEELKYLFSQS